MSNKNTFLARYGSSEDIHKILDDPGSEVKEIALNNPLATAEHLDKAQKSNNWFVREAAARSHNVEPRHLDAALEDKNSYVREAAAENPHLTPQHITKLLALPKHNSEDGYSNVSLKMKAIAHHAATHEHIMNALHDPDIQDRTVGVAVLRKDSDAIDHVLKNKNAFATHAVASALGTDRATDSDLRYGFEHSDFGTGLSVINNPRTDTHKHIIPAMDTMSARTAQTLFTSRVANNEVRVAALKSSNPSVVVHAAAHRNTNQEDIVHAAANHPNPAIRDVLKAFIK